MRMALPEGRELTVDRAQGAEPSAAAASPAALERRIWRMMILGATMLAAVPLLSSVAALVMGPRLGGAQLLPIVGTLLATGYCVIKGIEAASDVRARLASLSGVAAGVSAGGPPALALTRVAGAARIDVALDSLCGATAGHEATAGGGPAADSFEALLRELLRECAPLGEGAVLDRYRIVRRLGAGAMGQVWAAEDVRLGRMVAIKVLPPELSADRVRRARFEREARTLAALSHPGIVTVYAVEEVEGRPLLVMELVAGRTLSENIPEGGLEAAALLRTATALAEAVAAAHRGGVVHRDLKPDNVMITDDGRLKVLDFGLARLEDGVDPAGPTAALSLAGRLMGTAPYMSPEQALGATADARSDVVALGIVLFEMASGRRPFVGDSNLDVLAAIARQPPPSLGALHPGVPAGFVRVVERCLDKDAARRYQNAGELHAALRALPADPASAEAATALASVR